MRHIRQAEETDLDRIRKIVSSAIRQCVTDSNEHHEFLYTALQDVQSLFIGIHAEPFNSQYVIPAKAGIQ